MKNFPFILLISVILLSGSSSCKKDAAAKPDLGYNYFPDQIGKYVIYNVDSFYYDNAFYPVKIDTFKFQIKEKIQSIFNDNQNRPTMRLERYIKQYNPLVPYSNMSWILNDVWAQNRNARNAEKVEENVRFVKLIFPLNVDQTWNGNVQNSLEEETYEYAFFDLPRTVGGIRFDSVLQVTQHDETNLILRKYSEEKYARNVGMIYKRVINVNSQYPTSWNQDPFINDSLALFYPKPILKRVSSGFQFTMTITSYGTE